MNYAEMLVETLSLVAMSTTECCEAGVIGAQKHLCVVQPTCFLHF